jgi:hypothetical protein
MEQPDVIAHKVNPQEMTACTGALGAGIFQAQMDARKGLHTAGTDFYANANCTVPETYSSIDELLAAEKSAQANGKPLIEAFALPAQSSSTKMDNQVRDAIGGLEEQLGYRSGELNYLWFNDDAGKAEIFLLGRAEKKSEPAAQKTPEACVNFDSLVDNSSNQSFNLPRGTTEGELGNILKERRREADLAKLGIPINSSEGDVQAIQTVRLLDIKALEDRLPAPENSTEEQIQQFAQDKSAIEIGLPAGSSEAEIKQMTASVNLQARAIMLGLPQQSTMNDINSVEQQIQSTPDTDLNERMGLPAQTTRQDAQEQSLKWLKDAQLVEIGLSPDMTPEEIKSTMKERNDKISEIQSKTIFADDSNPQDKIAAENAIENIKIGLPENSTVQEYTDAMTKYHLEFLAVSNGLPPNATKEQIDAAEKRSDSQIPDNMCDVNPK